MPDPAQTAALVKQSMQVNLDRLEAQLSKQNKRFRVLNNEYNLNNNKRNSNPPNNGQSSSSLSKKSGPSKVTTNNAKDEVIPGDKVMLTPKDNV